MKLKFVIIAALLLGGLGALVWLATSGSSAAMASGLSVEDILAGKADGKRAKLQVQAVKIRNGFNPVEFEAVTIAPQEVQGDQAKLAAYLKAAPRITVRYDGSDKIALEDYSHASVEGTWDPEAKVFRASKMSTQCPSHYSEQKTPKPLETAAP